MTDEQTSVVRLLLDRYFEESDDRDKPYRDLARRHALLPILRDWSGFVGLRDDGTLLWVSDDDGSVSPDLTDHAVHLAKIRGAELFPELEFLAPKPAQDWIRCWSCGGSGKVMINDQHVADATCQCGGLGALPPGVAYSLRTRH